MYQHCDRREVPVWDLVFEAETWRYTTIAFACEGFRDFSCW